MQNLPPLPQDDCEVRLEPQQELKNIEMPPPLWNGIGGGRGPSATSFYVGIGHLCSFSGRVSSGVT